MPRQPGNTEHGAAVIRQRVIRLLKARGYLVKIGGCFGECYWVGKCQTSTIPLVPGQEFLERIISPQKR